MDITNGCFPGYNLQAPGVAIAARIAESQYVPYVWCSFLRVFGCPRLSHAPTAGPSEGIEGGVIIKKNFGVVASDEDPKTFEWR